MTVVKITLAGAVSLLLAINPAIAGNGINALVAVTQLKAANADDDADEQATAQRNAVEAERARRAGVHVLKKATEPEPLLILK